MVVCQLVTAANVAPAIVHKSFCRDEHTATGQWNFLRLTNVIRVWYDRTFTPCGRCASNKGSDDNGGEIGFHDTYVCQWVDAVSCRRLGSTGILTRLKYFSYWEVGVLCWLHFTTASFIAWLFPNRARLYSRLQVVCSTLEDIPSSSPTAIQFMTWSI